MTASKSPVGDDNPYISSSLRTVRHQLLRPVRPLSHRAVRSRGPLPDTSRDAF